MMTPDQIVGLLSQTPISVVLAAVIYYLYRDSRAQDRVNEQRVADNISQLTTAIAGLTVEVHRNNELIVKLIGTQLINKNA